MVGRGRDIVDMRCSACGEYLGRAAAGCTHARFCSTSCEHQKSLRRSEARDSLACDQLASGMAPGAVAEYHGVSVQVVYAIKKGF